MSFLVAEDEALKNLLKGIYVSDEKNLAREVGVWFAIPDVETRAQSFPFMTIELLDVNWASYRQQSGLWVDNDKQGTELPTAGISYEYEMPVTWDLMYQITTYSRHPRHDRKIIAAVLSNKFPANRGFLQVSNEIGTESSYRHLVLQDFVKRDTIEDGKRLFRNVFTVIVTSESVLGQGLGVPDVEQVRINNDPNYIPDGFTLL